MYSRHEISWCIGAGHQHNFKTPVIWLEHVRALIFQESIDTSFQMGAIHAIDWSSLLNFLPHVLKLTCAVTGRDGGDFTVSPAFHFEQNRRTAKPGIGIFENEGVAIGEEKLRELDAALTCFCRCVLQGQEIVGQDLIFPIEISERSADCVATLVDDFLTSSGGKKVGEARLLKTSGCEILVAGSYRPIKDKPLPYPKRKTITGKIDGLRGMIRTLFVNIGERKTIAVLFDEGRFKEPLRSRVLDDLVYSFVIDTEWVAHDKTVDTLVSFAPCDGGEPALL